MLPQTKTRGPIRENSGTTRPNLILIMSKMGKEELVGGSRGPLDKSSEARGKMNHSKSKISLSFVVIC